MPCLIVIHLLFWEVYKKILKTCHQILNDSISNAHGKKFENKIKVIRVIQIIPCKLIHDYVKFTDLCDLDVYLWKCHTLAMWQ